MISSNVPKSSFEGKALKKNSQIQIHYRLSFKLVCLCAVLIPLGALFICFVSANIFQFYDIHETHCNVFNIIPSISAITGISPQRYLWRMSVALHIGPRIITSAVYNAYQLKLINPLAHNEIKSKAYIWLNVAYYLNQIETAALCGVTYISNRENYPIHEKLFITFILSSLGHMLACIKGVKYVAESRNDLQSVQKALGHRKKLLIVCVLCSAGLVVFYMQHRFFCHRMAFSMFALCEYLIAVANVTFHVSIILDFPTEDLIVAKVLDETDGVGSGSGDCCLSEKKID